MSTNKFPSHAPISLLRKIILTRKEVIFLVVYLPFPLSYLLSHLPNVEPAGRTSTPPHTTHSPPNIIIIQHSPAPWGKSSFSYVLHGYDSNGNHDGNWGDGDGVKGADNDDDDGNGHGCAMTATATTTSQRRPQQWLLLRLQPLRLLLRLRDGGHGNAMTQ